MLTNTNTLSFWEREIYYRPYDILIIGAGIVGLNAAIFLKESAPKLRVGVLFPDRFPQGASTRNAGFACIGSLTELMDDSEIQTIEETLAISARRYQGLQLMRRRLGDGSIGYSSIGGYEIFLQQDEAVFYKALALMPLVNKGLKSTIGIDKVFRLADEKRIEHGLEDSVTHMIENQVEGLLDTGRMYKALSEQASARGVELLSHARVISYEEAENTVCVRLESGESLHCRQLLAATNGYTRKLIPELQVLPARNQVLLTTGIPKLRLQGGYHYDKGYVYFRNVGDRVLIGGARNLDPQTETTDLSGDNPRIQAFLLDFLKNVVLAGKNVEIEMQWTGILGVGEQKKPIISRLSPRVYAAVRMGGMGVAIGTLIGKESAEMMLQEI